MRTYLTQVNSIYIKSGFNLNAFSIYCYFSLFHRVIGVCNEEWSFHLQGKEVVQEKMSQQEAALVRSTVKMISEQYVIMLVIHCINSHFNKAGMLSFILFCNCIQVLGKFKKKDLCQLRIWRRKCYGVLLTAQYQLGFAFVECPVSYIHSCWYSYWRITMKEKQFPNWVFGKQ